MATGEDADCEAWEENIVTDATTGTELPGYAARSLYLKTRRLGSAWAYRDTDGFWLDADRRIPTDQCRLVKVSQIFVR